MKEVVFTGTFKLNSDHIVRSLLVESAEAHGYHVSSKVSPQTTFVVAGDTGHHGKTKKIKEAEQYGIPVVTPSDFIKDLL